MFRGRATWLDFEKFIYKERVYTYTEIPSSLIIYPIPYPSAATGPNPNSLKAGLPQLDVERMEVPRRAHPGSVYIKGILVIQQGPLGVSCLCWSWRWTRQYIAYKCLINIHQWIRKKDKDQPNIPILSQTLTTLFRQFNMRLACFPQSWYFLCRWRFRVENLEKTSKFS